MYYVHPYSQHLLLDLAENVPGDSASSPAREQKSEAQWWRCVSDIEGHPKIDSTLCKGPELISEYEGDAAEELRQFFGKQLANPLRR